MDEGGYAFKSNFAGAAGLPDGIRLKGVHLLAQLVEELAHFEQLFTIAECLERPRHITGVLIFLSVIHIGILMYEKNRIFIIITYPNYELSQL